MTVTESRINSPSPYFVLSKHKKIPILLSISNSEDIENDIKVATAHKIHALSCMTSLKAGDEVLPVPESIVAQGINTKKCDIIKTGSLSANNITTLGKRLNQENKPLVCNGSILSSTLLTKAIDTLGPFMSLLVLDSNKFDATLSSVEDINVYCNKLATSNDITNILMVNNTIDGKVVSVLYRGVEKDLFCFEGSIQFNEQAISTLTTAITSNLANGYPLGQTVYGGLEFTQTANILSQDETSAKLNLVHNIYIPLKDMVEDECFTSHGLITQPELISDRNITHQFLDYLNEHPYVSKHWDDYVNHDFVRQVAESRLDLQQFKFYIEQDYNYLADYARFHCISAAKAPNLIDIEKELYVLDRIKESMECHKKRLKDYFNVEDEHHMEKVQRSDALNEYTRYMGDISRRGNWRELIAALAPCMVGYCAAVAKYVGKTDPEEGTIYRDWTDFYSTLPIEESLGKGQFFLNHIAQTCPQDELDVLIKIYGDVCGLEAKFWDSPLQQTFSN